MRIGIGYDAHQLVEGHSLTLGGVEIPFERGLKGWSDADVVIHAIIDALLGAAALGDIGIHFPDNDPEYRGISSMVLLTRTGDLLRDKGWCIVNIDVTIIAERPKIQQYIKQMKNNIGRSLSITDDQVGIKATTTERMGFTGREEGIAAFSAALLNKA